MTSFPQPQNYIFNTFRGIRTRNGVNTNGQISASECINIDFKPNDVNAEIQIKTTLGNVSRGEFENHNIIKGFETVQEGVEYCLLYVENETQGQLVKYDSSNSQFTVLIENLTKTGKANGITMVSGAYDVFVFTNGVEYYSVNFEVEPICVKLSPIYNQKPVTGLALCEQNGSLIIGSEKGYIIASRKGDIGDWDYVSPDIADENKPWYQIFGKKVTAVISYIGGILVFSGDDSTFLEGNFSVKDSAKRYDASLGGCFSFESWCFHDKYLFFYDDNQKNIYYYTQNNIGQKVLGEPIAPEIQNFFYNISKFQMVSYIGNNKNEIWILTDKNKLIYDYFISEWSERVCQDISSYFIYKNNVFSTTPSGKLLEEKIGENGIFDNVFYGSTYTMQTINLGSYSNLKEMEIQPLFTVTQNYNNEFLQYCEINGKKVKSKLIKMYSIGAIWGDDSNPAIVPDEEKWDIQTYCYEDDAISQQVKGKFVSNWYYLKFTLKTEKQGQDFCIKAFELKGITQETDTVGRK